MTRPQIVGDRYEIIGRIGKGGMANVYRAKDSRLLREIAVKILQGADEESLFYFHREARAIAALRHQNIVQIYDYSGPKESPAYIVMELIEGGNIDEVLMTRHPLPEDIIVSSAYSVASALQHAHEHGVIHRDIKPANVMVEDSGRLLLTDFGIAKAYRDAAQLGQTFCGKQTQLFGTPDFMAPEQILEEELGPHTDVFTLGSLIYCLATNYSPFDHTDTVEILRRVVDVDYEPLENRRQDLSSKLNAIVSGCLQADVRARPTSARVAEYCEDLLFEHRISNSQRNIQQYLRGERADGDKPLGVGRDLKGDDTEDDLAWSGDDGAPTEEKLPDTDEQEAAVELYREEDSRRGDTQIYGDHPVDHQPSDGGYLGEIEDEASTAATGEVDGLSRPDAAAEPPDAAQPGGGRGSQESGELAAKSPPPSLAAARHHTLVDRKWLDPRSPVVVGVLTTLLVTIILTVFLAVRDSDDGAETAEGGIATEVTEVADEIRDGATARDETAALDAAGAERRSDDDGGGDLTDGDLLGAEGSITDEGGSGGGTGSAGDAADTGWEEAGTDTAGDGPDAGTAGEESGAWLDGRGQTRPGKSRTKVKGKKKKRAQVKRGKTTITVTVKPWGTVFLDGTEKGNTPVVRVIEVKPGKHTIKVNHPTLGTAKKTVNVRAGDNAPVVIDLRKK